MSMFSVLKIDMKALLVFSLMLLSVSNAYGVIETYDFEQLEQREQFARMNELLRCPLCQNQSIGESNAPVANDLRREVYRLITQEQANDEEIAQFMLARYGDFVLYRPPLDKRTVVLWFGPVLLLLLGCIALVRLLGNRNTFAKGDCLNDQEKETLKKLLNDQSFRDRELGGKES